MAAPGKSHSKESVGREKDCGEKGGGQEAEKRCTVESRLSLRQRQQVSRSLHLQSDQEFIGRSKERSKQSLDKHKQVRKGTVLMGFYCVIQGTKCCASVL